MGTRCLTPSVLCMCRLWRPQQPDGPCVCLSLPRHKVKLKGSEQVASGHEPVGSRDQNLDPEQPSRAWPLRVTTLNDFSFNGYTSCFKEARCHWRAELPEVILQCASQWIQGFVISLVSQMDPLKVLAGALPPTHS